MGRKKNYIVCDVCWMEFLRPDRLPEGDFRFLESEIGIYNYIYSDRCVQIICPDCAPSD